MGTINCCYIRCIIFPCTLSCALLLIFDRSFGTSFYLSDIIINGEALHNTGGSPILFEHLLVPRSSRSLYYSFPALGIVSEVISVNSRKPIFGYKAMVGAYLLLLFYLLLFGAPHVPYRNGPILGSVFTFTHYLLPSLLL